MIPLCHPLLVGAVSISFDIGDDHVAVETFVDTVDRTGVEMEALHALRHGGAHDLRHVQVGRPWHDDR
ncbi:MAG: cyclic pyranopterin monophosphate synthase MoaC [Ilumatobacteraceae bacterium]